MIRFRQSLVGIIVAIVCLIAPLARADDAKAQDVLRTWVRLSLELVRHTPTYTPPVAARSFAYLGVTAFEVVALDSPQLQSLAGQLNGLTPVPQIEQGAVIDRATVLHSALGVVVAELFANTGPTGQRALGAVTDNLRADVTAGLDADLVQYSTELGVAIGAHIVAWAATDGGAVVENMGFPADYTLTEGPDNWMPTNLIRLQQTPLLPNWGQNRPFAMPVGTACPVAAPLEYSEDPASEFYAEAQEVVDVKAALTPEQIMIARFWADDAMLSMTPPGHWVAITMQIFEREDTPLDAQAEVLAKLGVAVADAFIGCWQAKYDYNLLRPVTYIRRLIDPNWESLIASPPFPEYPSGHSVQSAAAAEVLSGYFGPDFAFEDTTRVEDGLPARTFPSFLAAAQEAAQSRLYGGIHFRAAIQNGFDQGLCIGAYAAALQTRSQ